MVCEEYFNRVNKTYSKPFSKRQALPRHVMDYASKGDKILDYGAGKDAFGTLFLRGEGYNCTAWEIGSNFNPGLHDKDAINREYDVVFASNVLNVQSSVSEIIDVIMEIQGLLKSNGKFICNFPKKPRHSDVDEDYIDALLGLGFKKVTRMENSSPTWVCER